LIVAAVAVSFARLGRAGASQRAQELTDGAPTDVEHAGSALDGNGQAIVEID